jgi:hypothetical protein
MSVTWTGVHAPPACCWNAARRQRPSDASERAGRVACTRFRRQRLGNPKLSDARRHAATARKESAEHYAANVLPVIREIQASGLKSLASLKKEASGHESASVYHCIARL